MQVPPGVYKLKYRAADGAQTPYQTQWSGGATSFATATTLTHGTSPDDVGLIKLTPAYALAGTVIGMAAPGQAPASGLPLAGIEVDAYLAGDPSTVVGGAVTGSDGVWRINNLAKGAYSVEFVSADNSYFDTWFDDNADGTPDTLAVNSTTVSVGCNRPDSGCLNIGVGSAAIDASCRYDAPGSCDVALKSKPGDLDTPPTPSITGTQAVGNTLSADGGTWGPAPVDLSYQWFEGGIQVGTDPTYPLTATFTITVTSPGGTATGSMRIRLGARTLKHVMLKHGRATVTVKKLKKGKRTYTITYAGRGSITGSTSKVRVRIK